MFKYSAQNAFLKLEQLKKEITELIDPYTTQQLNFKANHKEWTVMQILEHIRVAEKQTLNALKNTALNSGGSVKIPLSSYIKLLVIITLFRLKVKLKAPAHVSSKIPEYIEKDTFLIKWSQDRAKWGEYIDTNIKNNIFPTYSHPVIGRAHMGMLLLFMAEHLNRHFFQIKKIIISKNW